MATIKNVYVEMESQAQCDRMKQLCIDNGLPILDSDYSFTIINDIKKYFEFDQISKTFYVSSVNLAEKKVTESEFLKLIKMPNYKNDPTEDFDYEPNAEDIFYKSDPKQESLDYVKELQDKISFIKKELKDLYISEENTYLNNLINKIK